MLAIVASSGCSRPEPAAVDPPNVIIYLVDTLRRDVLGCYGGDPELTPHVDAFASRALVYENAIAESSWTRSSVASLFTGLRPRSHGVVGRSHSLAAEAETLAEVLRDNGYETAAFITNGNAGATYALDQGFEVFELLGEKPGPNLHSLSDEVNEAVFSWLDQREGSRPFLLYVHTMDPHDPYLPREDLRGRFLPPHAEPEVTEGMRQEFAQLRSEFSGRFRPEVLSDRIGSIVWAQALKRSRIEPTEQIRTSMKSLYEAEVAFNDSSFGAFIDGLEARGLLGDSLVAFTSDHGEEFLEHGGWAHGRTLYDESVRIPLLLKPPDGLDAPAGRVDELAQLADLMPTALAVVGIEAERRLEGRNLLARPEEPRTASRRFAVSHVHLEGIEWVAVAGRRWKLITYPGAARPPELYDRLLDPGETRNVLAENRLVGDRLARELASLHSAEGAAELQPGEVEPDADLRERLRALGYLGN